MRLRKTKTEKAKALVVLSACALIMSLALTIGQDASLANIGQLLFFPLCALLVFAVLRHRKLKTTSERPGLLTSKKRPPLTKPEVRRHIFTLTNAMRETAGARKRPPSVPDTPSLMAQKEILRLAQLWADAENARLSDDELRSIDIIFRCGIVQNGRLKPLEPELEAMIGDFVTVNAFREKVQIHVAEQAQRKALFAAWQARVGDPDASHLLEDGWIAFLQGLEAPDIQLWHSVVCDFHEIWGDRLDAAYWICAQAACDRATVWTFVAGLATQQILQTQLRYAARRGGDLERIAAAYSDIVRHWNNGFYRYHSITNDDDLLDPLDRDAAARVNAELEAIEAEFDVRLARVTYLDFDRDAATDDFSRNTPSGFAFWDDEGLHLSYPHDWPEKKPAA